MDSAEMSEPIKLTREQAGAYLGTFGNTGYLWHYIDYFEKRIPAEVGEVEAGHMFPHLLCPNHAAWLRLYTEVISMKTLYKVFLYENCSVYLTDLGFNKSTNKIARIALEGKTNEAEIAELKDRITALKTVIELRHTIQHGGLPNILRETIFKEINTESLRDLISPSNYRAAKITFSRANKLLEIPPLSDKVLVGYADGTTLLQKKRKA